MFQIVHYPHPALKFRSVDIQRIDKTLRETVRHMFDLMYEANGIGLAANQVGLPFRFFLMNLEARPDEQDEEFVFINPIITKKKGSVVGEEGCLSLPGLYGDVTRYDEVTIEAFDLSGQPFAMELSDLPARVVQHETDHLDGIMFTDRMRDEGTSENVDLQLPKFVKNFRDAQSASNFPDNDAIENQLKTMADSGQIPASFLKSEVYRLTPPNLIDNA